ncbi:MAG: hypothetical protein XD58_1073 [Thermotoga sp. 50_1627]|uniref:hypothetical protein n=1 Tax=Pseudothermotoga sp. TaxID=2033661 RepID=UPI00076D6CF6|nr:MAG: hypothetical protein XD45_1345 [Thermotoga sp. 50_64]KUK24956.1 MAG: hypothetical protein XD58_1073 [Thermotoga sp. 50_1627]MBC7116654.1 hypothetical protein [Pseudothermotoga sp.]MDK2922763.1 hypothetical protein [Pseudothermotoga sp.]HBT39309.1 hypothetical protein [Pseudothermotoga sp.]
MKFLTVLLVCLGVLASAQIRDWDISSISRMSKLAVRPDMLVFFSGLPQEKSVLIYNFGNAPAKWSLGPASKFLKIDTSQVPNPLPPMMGGTLKVSVVWDLVPTEAATVEKPGTLKALLEKLLGVDIPERYKHFGVGLFSISNQTNPGYHIVTVFTIMY